MVTVVKKDEFKIRRKKYGPDVSLWPIYLNSVHFGRLIQFSIGLEPKNFSKTWAVFVDRQATGGAQFCS